MLTQIGDDAVAELGVLFKDDRVKRDRRIFADAAVLRLALADQPLTE